MAYGIWTRPVGPGPAAPADIYIDSGSTFPQLRNRVSGNFSFSGNTCDLPISGWDGSGQIVVVPTGSVVWERYIPPNVTSDVYWLTDISVINNSTFRVTMDYNVNGWVFDMAFNVYQIWPRANRNYGITFSNSADYFSISDSGVVGQCIWAWEGDINGALQIPDIGGFDMSRATVYANWSNGGAGLLYNPSNRVVYVYQNRSHDNGNTNQTGSIGGVRIAVFCDGSGVPTHNGGLNIFSPNGSQCVFSTYRTPFSVERFMPMSGGNTSLAYPMIPLSYGAGAIRGKASGWYFQHARSHMMNGSSFGTGFGRMIYSWSSQYDLGGGGALGLSIPILDARKIFRSIQ
ncbi:membrane protein [Escherichia phage MN05]|uniref:Uncharacterized protein n=1 Tax=Escherichia phage MN05 TaxID=2711185 RepID=A0A858I5L1_9CAUD|nr:membrane protein [Escherichia phage MN05]QIN96079.1 hypothetical protein MN05_00014 [Escherichia phage MN05]